HNNKIKFAGLLTDSAAYRYAGMMKDLNAIFSFMKMNYYDSSVSGTWRNAQMVANSSALVSPGINGLPESIMPDVVGMGLKDALYLLENRGMKVGILGKGKVISQSLAAGSTVSNGQKINLLLN
ncbi:MAG TPA: PASTA domain-containing protein, partial [Ferruginibacter sp.]|nr:PASTA domain-containing protein [Ferruginibacter sp.]